MNTFKALIISLSILTLASCNPSSQSYKTPSTAQEALSALLEGNKRFVNSEMIYPNSDINRVTQTAAHQEPFAAIVGCSDSRVPIELIFDQGLGDIFVIRTAGNNVADDMVMGSIEYAVDHLCVKVLLVLGHGSCGGVTSAISSSEHSGSIGNLLHHIQNDIPEYVGKPELLEEAILKHTHSQIETILQNNIIAEKLRNGELIIKAAYYDVNSGRVKLL